MRAIAAAVIRKTAKKKNHPPDLINIALEKLLEASLELPGFSTLESTSPPWNRPPDLAGGYCRENCSAWSSAHWRKVRAGVPVTVSTARVRVGAGASSILA